MESVIVIDNAIFVSNSNYLKEGGGGVQWCTRDYLSTLTHAGLNLATVSYSVDMSIATRLRRRLWPAPFKNCITKRSIDEVAAACESQNAKWIFLNNAEALPFALEVRKLINDRSKLVYLSHGAEFTDHVNGIRLSTSIPNDRKSKPRWIGKLVLSEIEMRKHIDAVVCISDEDTTFERFFGSKRICYLPRTITRRFLDRDPIAGRLGTVGTLNHIPNLNGIREFARELSSTSGAVLRVVGGPKEIGSKLAEEFANVQYLGPLNDTELESEVKTWSAFVNPIFCLARGASTKVATAAGWGLPVLSTREGVRGYKWPDSLPLATTPKELVCLVNMVDQGDSANEFANAIVNSSPTFEESGAKLRRFLDQLIGSI